MPTAHAAWLGQNVIAVMIMTVWCLQAVVRAPNKVVLRFVTNHLPMSTGDKLLKVFLTVMHISMGKAMFDSAISA